MEGIKIFGAENLNEVIGHVDEYKEKEIDSEVRKVVSKIIAQSKTEIKYER